MRTMQRIPATLLFACACAADGAEAPADAVTTGGATTDPPGPDTDAPYPIDMGDAPGAPGSYKGLPLQLTDTGAPEVTAVDGVVGVVCIGMSNATQECSHYIRDLAMGTHDGVDAQVVVVDCAVGSHAIERWNDPVDDAVLWDACVTTLAIKGVDPEQVRVLYHKAANQFTGDGDGAYPPYPDPDSDYENFIANLDTFATRVTQKFPSVQAVYTTSRGYGGFANAATRGEPLSYEEGHALNTWLADNAEVDGVWYGWGPYIWAPSCDSGLVNASDVCYVAEDYRDDGVHPADGALDKISGMIHARFVAEAWYAGTG